MPQRLRREHEARLVRQDDGSVWRPDAALVISFSPTWQVTDHPVESGVTVSDNVQKQPNNIIATMVVSENPVNVGGVTGGPLRLREAMAWLTDTADNGRLVNVVTRRLGVFKNYLITALPHQLDKVSRLQIPIALREVRIAVAETVQITVADVEGAGNDTEAGAPDEIDSGEQPTTGTEGAAEEDDQSTLASLLDAL